MLDLQAEQMQDVGEEMLYEYDIPEIEYFQLDDSVIECLGIEKLVFKPNSGDYYDE